MDVMRAALGLDGLGGPGRAAAKVVLAVGLRAEVGGVAIDANFRARFKSVIPRV